MRPLHTLLTAILLVALSDRSVPAAEFQVVELADGRGPAIQLSGQIEEDDAAAFHEQAEKLGDAAAMVITTGPGGLVAPAIAIGTEIRNRGWSTLVPPGARCASACSFIWLAGQTRMMGAGAQVGFHAMAYIRGTTRTEEHDDDIRLRQWLTSMGYALDTTATIVNTEAASVRWLGPLELRANGIATVSYP